MAKSDSPSTTRETLKAGCSDAAARTGAQISSGENSWMAPLGLARRADTTSPNMPIPRYFSMPPVRLEPTTFGLKASYFLGFCRKYEQLRSSERS